MMIFRKVLSIGLAGAVGAVALVDLPVTSASAATSYKACANKKTGEMRLVVKGKECKKNEKKLTWNSTGPQGPTGPAGPQGTPGQQGKQGLPGAYKALDQLGREVGPLFGLYSGVLPMIRLNSGAYLAWDNVPTNPNSTPLVAPELFYRQAACAGDAYSVYGGGPVFEMGIIMSATAAPGSPVFMRIPGTPQAFTAASVRTPAGCAASATAVANGYVVKEAGTVPVVAQPMVFVPAS